MALVLAIGIVVDDAIVMGENISRRLEKGETSLVAAYRGSKQVAFAIIATTVVLVSVFIPLIFIKGLIGKLFSEMALTLSFAVVISSFVALSLSPMIGSKFLKISKKKPRPILKFEKYLNRFQKFYEETLNYMLKRRKSIFVFLTLILISIVSLFNFTKKELMPKEDRGVFFVIIQAPEGSGFNYTAEKALDIESKFLPKVGKGEIRRLLLRVPGFGKRSKQLNSAFIIVLLEDWSKRKRSGQSILRNLLDHHFCSRRESFPVMPQSIRGGGVEKPIQFVLLGSTYEKLEKWKNILKAEARKNGKIINISDDYELTKPELKVEINNQKAADLGVSIEQIGRTIETIFGSRKVTKFTNNGKEYSIVLQADLKDRTEPANLNKVYVRSETSKKLIPLSNVIKISESAAAPF